MTVATNLPIEARACVDAIYSHESGGDYTILFGGKPNDPATPHFTADTPSLPGHYGFPDWPGVVLSNGQQTHAAGAGQFQPATWLDVAIHQWPAGSTPNFRNPADQDWGTWFNAKTTVGADLLPRLQAGNLAGIGEALHGQWTSVSEETFPARYTAALAALQAAAPTPAPAPAPPAPEPPAPPPVTPPAPPAPARPPTMIAAIADIEAHITSLQADLAKYQAALDALKALPV